MLKSTITSKNQITVPRDVRRRLRVGSGDMLVWEIRGGKVEVSAASSALARHRGSIKVGRGSVSADIARARRMRGASGG